MATMNRVTVSCPVCGTDMDVPVKATLVPSRGRPGRARMRVEMIKPFRIPAKHRSCIGKVEG